MPTPRFVLFAPAVANYNREFPLMPITIKNYKKSHDRFHDRFLVIDRKTLIHIGASLNYLGKKCFAVSTFDPLGIPELIAKLPS